MIRFEHRGSFDKTESFLKQMSKQDIRGLLNSYGKAGVAALSSATPKDSGLAASSWDYEVRKTHTGYSIVWTNDNIEKGQSVILLLQYGHGTGTGGYVQGKDFINPAIKPIFDEIAAKAWKVVTAA